MKGKQKKNELGASSEAQLFIADGGRTVLLGKPEKNDYDRTVVCLSRVNIR